MDMSKKSWLGIPYSILLFYKYAKGCKKIYHDFITYKRNPLKSLIKMKVLGEHYNNGTQLMNLLSKSHKKLSSIRINTKLYTEYQLINFLFDYL